MKKIAFIGAGKVGNSLADYFSARGYVVAGIWDKDASLKDISQTAEVLFLTVPDDDIPIVWQELQPYLTNRHWVFHCSGAADSGILAPNPEMIPTFSFHPIMAFSQRHQPLAEITAASFTLEGSDDLTDVLAFFEKLPNPIAVIDAAEKVRYHAACVLLANQMTALVAMGSQLFQDCGLPANFSQQAWQQLFRQNADNLLAKGPLAALTGPVQRNDTATVEKHLGTLSGDEQQIYRLLSKQLLLLAQEKRPTVDFTSLERILNS